jgi:hypothetical protein
LVHSKTLVWGLERKSMTGTVLKLLPRGGVRVQFGNHISGYGGSFDFSKSQREDLIPVQEAIAPIAKTSTGVGVVLAQEAPLESKFGRIVYPRPTQNLLEHVVENIPGVEVARAQEPVMKTVEASPCVDVELIEAQLQEPLLESSPGACDCPFCGAQHGLFVDKDHLDRRVIRCLHCSYSRFKNYPGAIRTLAQEEVLDRTVYPKQVAKPIARAAESSGGIELTTQIPYIPVPDFELYPAHRLIVPMPKNSPGVDPGADFDRAEEPIVETVEASPSVEVEPAEEPIVETVEASPGVEVDQVPEAIVSVAKTSTAKVSSSKKVKANSYLDCPSCGIGRLRVKQSIYWETSCAKCGYFAESLLYPFTPADTGYKVGDWVKLRVKPRLATNIGRGDVVCIDKVQDDCLRFVNPNLNPALVIWARRQFLYPHEVIPCEPPVVKAAETFPGVKTEVTVSESAIAQAALKCPSVHCQPETDLNPILTGIVFSDKFLARYSPPQTQTIHFQSEATGQLSLVNFQVVTESEPPDPDDFESLEDFREAIARWDLEHSSSSCFDHCSDLPNSEHSEPNSVYSEPPDPYDFDSMFEFWAAYDAWDEASDDDSEPLKISLDSFCEWAPCPADWYEPAALLDPSKVMELSPVHKNSSTSDFFIPTFNCWGDRFNRSDEPPDTGIFARLPKPKPPSFPPQSASWTQVGRKLDTSWTQVGHKSQVSPSQPKSAQVSNKSARHPETIPKLSRNYPETIPKLSRNYFTASPLAAAPSQPDRPQEVMRCPKRHYLRESLDNFSSQNQRPRSFFFKALRRSLPSSSCHCYVTERMDYLQCATT